MRPIKVVTYPRTLVDGKMVRTHIWKAETALGRKLPPKAEVHHFDGNEQNNDSTNLIICPDHAYHMLLHVRLDAYMASGNPDYRRCGICRQYDDVKNLSGQEGYRKHRHCHTLKEKKRRYAKRGIPFLEKQP